MKGLFACKPMQQILNESGSEGRPRLIRCLGPKDLIGIGIGAIIGTGIFVLTGTAAANHAGPALVLSFVLAGFGCAFAGLCYAEFASMIPVSGSAYAYTYATLGEFTAWFIGWNLILEYLFCASTVAVGWSGYVVSLFDQLGLHLPDILTHAPLGKVAGSDHIIMSGAILNLPAIFIIALMSGFCYVGIRQSAWINNLVVAIKVLVILLFIAFGISFIVPSNWVPFIPPNTGKFGHFGWSGIATGASVIFFAYIGFDAVSTTAQEARNPKRDMPIGILGSLVVCTVLYIAMALVMTGMVSYKELNVPAPVALALDKFPQLAWLAIPVKLGAICGMTSVILVMLLGQPRIFLNMADDGLLPPIFAKVHPKYRTPHLSTVITGIGGVVISGILPVDILGEIASIGTLMAFVVVCIGVLVLRKTRPDIKRSFKVPKPWFTCLAGAIVCGYMMYALPQDTWIRLVVWTAIGLVIYFFYGMSHSRLRNDPKAGACMESDTGK
jgi:basic amino acid/polyamine antiporter, APA family